MRRPIPLLLLLALAAPAIAQELPQLVIVAASAPPLGGDCDIARAPGVYEVYGSGDRYYCKDDGDTTYSWAQLPGGGATECSTQACDLNAGTTIGSATISTGAHTVDTTCSGQACDGTSFSNVNAAQVDGLEGAALAQLAGAQTFTGKKSRSEGVELCWDADLLGTPVEWCAQNTDGGLVFENEIAESQIKIGTDLKRQNFEVTGVFTIREDARAGTPVVRSPVTGGLHPISGDVSVADGGTGAGTASGARANLAAAPSAAGYWTTAVDGELSAETVVNSLASLNTAVSANIANGPHTTDTDTTCLDAGVTCNFAASSTEGGAATTALALDATPTLCPAGQYARGVLTNGNATGCTADQSGGGGSTVVIWQKVFVDPSDTTSARDLNGDGDHYGWLGPRVPAAFTISSVHCLMDPGDSGDTATVDALECVASPWSCAVIGNDKSLSNGQTDLAIASEAVASGAYLAVDFEAVAATVEQVVCTFVGSYD